ncbi:MAG: hypothetical protein KDA84_29305 [Planctomycetaceae bacterium]|nr:hypothetical protein [Planctomycetaceae bacterium]
MILSITAMDASQKKKALLIPVLVIGLVYALFSGPEDVPPNPQSPNQPAPAVASPPKESPREKGWTASTLDEVVKFSPFPLPSTPEPSSPEVPTETVSKEAEEQAAHEPADVNLQKWESQRVSIIYQGPNGPVAVIGEQNVEIGDMLDVTTQVVDIRADGVWVARVSQRGQDQHNKTSNPPSLLQRLFNLGKKIEF